MNLYICRIKSSVDVGIKQACITPNSATALARLPLRENSNDMHRQALCVRFFKISNVGIKCMRSELQHAGSIVDTHGFGIFYNARSSELLAAK